MKKRLDDYLLGLPGILIMSYLAMQVENLPWRWGIMIFSLISFLITYPGLMSQRPHLRATRSLDRFNQPDMGRKAGGQALGINDLANASSSGDTSDRHELVGLVGLVGLIEVWLKRWGLMIISLPWLVVIKIKQAN